MVLKTYIQWSTKEIALLSAANGRRGKPCRQNARLHIRTGWQNEKQNEKQSFQRYCTIDALRVGDFRTASRSERDAYPGADGCKPCGSLYDAAHADQRPTDPGYNNLYD